MNVLVINSGSSSIKFSILRCEAQEVQTLFEGEASGLGTNAPELRFADADGNDRTGGTALKPSDSAPEASRAIAELVTGGGLPEIDAVGYRVVHSGAKLTAHTRITPAVLEDLREAIQFAPLHQPPTIRIIEEMQRRFAELGHYACFDTVFHETMPEEAKTYPLPEAVRARGVRRYGFHGLSCESVVFQLRQAASREDLPFPRRMVFAHLGSGSSVTAIVEGRSVDTTMGLTPDGGIVMGTRPGDLDPGVVLYLLRLETGDRDRAAGTTEAMLNRDAGMHALSGLPNDVKRVRQAAKDGDRRAILALAVFTRSVRKAIGGYLALMGGAEAVVFAGGIGEHDAASRQQILGGLDALGLTLDDGRNQAPGSGLRPLSADRAPAAIYIVPAEENAAIARHVFAMRSTGA